MNITSSKIGKVLVVDVELTDDKADHTKTEHFDGGSIYVDYGKNHPVAVTVITNAGVPQLEEGVFCKHVVVGSNPTTGPASRLDKKV